nr:hypothetical protein [Collimonas arenae]
MVAGVSKVFGGISGAAGTVNVVAWSDSLDFSSETFGLGAGVVVLAAGGGSGTGMNSGPFWPQAASNADKVSVAAIIAAREKSKVGFTD